MIDFAKYNERVATAHTAQRYGRVQRIVGLSVSASGPAVSIGELCRIETRAGSRLALVTGFNNADVTLQPLDHIDGIRPGDAVIACDRGLEVDVGPGLVGRIVDALGRPIDGKGPIGEASPMPVHAEPPPALTRAPIHNTMETGIKLIDGLFTLGIGQRMGIFAGSGVGKSVLMGQLATFASADVNVIALVGERGREVGEFVRSILGDEGLARSVVIVATSDRPAVERMTAAYTAHAIAEGFRDRGQQVLLMLGESVGFVVPDH